MKQIKITTLHKGNPINDETFYVEHMDIFLRDCIKDLIQAKTELNNIIGNHNISYIVSEIDINVIDNYDLYKFIKNKINYTKDNIEKFNNHNEKLVKVMKKWYI